MRTMMFIFIFFVAGSASGKEDRDWHWRNGVTSYYGWFETHGRGNVRIHDGKIQGSLFDHESESFERIRINGAIEDDEARIEVIILRSGVPKFEHEGTYLKEEIQGRIYETMMFFKKASYLVLTRNYPATSNDAGK